MLVVVVVVVAVVVGVGVVDERTRSTVGVYHYGRI